LWIFPLYMQSFEKIFLWNLRVVHTKICDGWTGGHID
jgi:hypothetical protein